VEDEELEALTDLLDVDPVAVAEGDEHAAERNPCCV
jgi:hypothetical protein